VVVYQRHRRVRAWFWVLLVLQQWERTDRDYRDYYEYGYAEREQEYEYDV
jgi:hypothetical protein